MAKRGRQGEGGGKPRIELTEAQIELVEQMAAELVSREVIAGELGIDCDTLTAILKRDPEVSRRYARARASKQRTLARVALEEAEDGNTSMLQLAVKVHLGWRETQAVELTGKDGGPIQSETTVSDDLRSVLDAIAGKIAGGGQPG